MFGRSMTSLTVLTALAVLLAGCEDEAKDPFVRVVSPNGGETWYFDGRVGTVTWESGRIGDLVDIYYSIDNGDSWALVDNNLPNTGTYDWQIPEGDSIECFVRVQKAGGLGASDVSDAAFTIASATVALVSPAGGEEWPRGVTQTVEWTSVGLADVWLEISTDNGVTWQDIVPSTGAPAGSYDWDVTGVEGSVEALVRVSDATDGSPSDELAAVLTITAIDVTSPDGGETWFYQGRDETVTWTMVGLQVDDKVDIQYSVDGGTVWKDIALDQWNTGTHDWAIPDDVADQCLVRVRQTGGTGTEDVSAAVFSIVQATVTLDSPTTGADWVEWFAYDIEWTATGAVTNVDILYSWDYGDTWSGLPGGYNVDAAASPFTWTVQRPTSEGYSCLIRVADHAEPSNAGTSDVVNITPIVWAIQTPGMEHFGGSSFAWGDYNADGDLDFAVSGSPRDGSDYAYVYLGDGAGGFTGTALSDGFLNGHLDWSDTDLDGDIDLGVTGFYVVDGVFTNSGGNFTLVSTGFDSVEASTLAWGDYDNDGDFDCLVAGQDIPGGAPLTILYKNTNGTFADSGIALMDLEWSVAEWGDADNDGDVDLILAGQDNAGVNYTRLYRNDGGGSFAELDGATTGLPDLGNGAVAWGDYDADGDLDLAIGGYANSGADEVRVYTNDGGLRFSPDGAGYLGLYRHALAWGDADCDGDLDLAMMGRGYSPITIIWRNDDGSFFDTGLNLIEVSQGDFGWGDWDADGDLDIAITGSVGAVEYLWIYENFTPASHANTRPPAPTDLSVSNDSGTLTLQWKAPTGDETPMLGLSYFVEVWTGSTYYARAMADPVSGEGYVPMRGPIQPSLFENQVQWEITVTRGSVYDWRVQSVDAGLRRSPWAEGDAIDVP